MCTMKSASSLSLLFALALVMVALRSVSTLNFTLPPLTYGYASLQPFIDNQVWHPDHP